MKQHTVIIVVLLCVCRLWAQTAPGVFSATGETDGLCVRIGTTDGAMECELANGGRIVVHGMSLGDVERDAARKYIAGRNLQGVVSVERYSSLATLPFCDNLVNLVVADLAFLSSKGLTEQEIMRIVAPEGAAYITKGGSWTAVRKAQPAGYGEYSMYAANAQCNSQVVDTNIKPPNSLRWIADYPDRDNGFGLNEGTGCRVWHDKLIGVEGSEFDREAHLWLKCRNAYNGRLLWRRKTLPKTTKSDYAPRGRALCLGDNKLFTYIAEGQPLAALDLETGETVRTYEGGPVLNRTACKLEYATVLYHDGKVLQAYNTNLCVHDATTGRLLWNVTDGPYPYACIAGGNVYAAKGTYNSDLGRADDHGTSSIVCFDLTTGSRKWSAGSSGGDLRYYGGKLVQFQGAYACCGQTNGHIAVVDPSDGRQIWKNNYPQLPSVGECLFLGDKVYATGSNYSGSVAYDLTTGSSQTLNSVSGVHGACKRNIGTSGYLVVNGMYFVDKDQNATRSSMSRAGCGSSVHPANGMVYAPPSGCNCYKMLHGYLAVAGITPDVPVPDNERLETHSAAPAKLPANTVWPADDEWPMFMANPRRGSYTPTGVFGGVKKKWSVKITNGADQSKAWDDFTHNLSYPGVVTPPTVSGGRVFVSVTHTHEVVALGASGGNELWRFTAGGRVDGPPTIYGDLCVFGCRDGWLYCLNATSGKLIWRFFTGRSFRKMMAYGQLESPWAHAGSAMIYNGHVYAVAGRFSESDGGFYVYKVDAYTGTLVFSQNIPYANTQSGGVRGGTPLNSMLRPMQFDGKILMMDYIAVHPELNKAVAVSHRLDVHNPPEREFARFPDVTAEQWDYTKWQVGRYHSSKFNYINLDQARGGGSMNYGYGRFGWGSTYACLTADHMTAISKGSFIKVPLKQSPPDSVGNPAWKSGEVPADAPVVHTPARDESIRGTAETGKNFLMLYKKLTASKLRVVTTGSATGQEFDLPAEPVWHGLAVAGGEVFVSTVDGTVTCFGEGVAGVKVDPSVHTRILRLGQTSGGFLISVDRATDLTATVYDCRGAVVVHRYAQARQLVIPLHGLARGHFLLKGQAGRNRFMKRLLIVR